MRRVSSKQLKSKGIKIKRRKDGFVDIYDFSNKVVYKKCCVVNVTSIPDTEEDIISVEVVQG